MPRLSSIIEQVSGAFKMVKGKDVDFGDVNGTLSNAQLHVNDKILIDDVSVDISSTQNASIFTTTVGNLKDFINTNITGNSNITTLGTITTGTWNATAIAHDYIDLDAIDGTNIQDNAIDSEHYTDGSIDHEHLAADAVDGDNIADDSIDSEHYVDGSIDTAHIADNQVTLSKMAGIAQGGIIHGDDNGDPAYLTKGEASQVLRMDTSGNNLEWHSLSNFSSGFSVNTTSTDATFYPIFVDGSSGNKNAKVNTNFTYNPNSTELLLSSSTASKPRLTIRNISNDTNDGCEISLTKLRADDGVEQGQNLGEIWFRGQNSNQIADTGYAFIIGEIDVGTNNEESGALKLGVANHDGDLQTGFSLTGGSSDSEIDVSIGLGSDSVTTIKGDVVVEGDSLTVNSETVLPMKDEDDMSSNSATHVPTQQSVKAYVDANAGGGAIDDLSDVDTSGDEAPSVNDVLKWNGSNWVPAVYNATFTFSVKYNRLDTPDAGTSSQLLVLMGSGQYQSSIIHDIDYNNGPSGSFSSAPTVANVGNTPGNSVTGGYPLTTTSNGTVATSSAINYPASLVHTYFARFIFRVTATHGGTTDNNGPDFYLYFRNKKFFGPQAASSLTSAQVIGLSNNDWMMSGGSYGSTDVYTQAEVSITCNNQYVYYCYPSRITGTPTFKINGFTTPFTDIVSGSPLSVTNASGFTETYKVWQSENSYGASGAATLTFQVI